MESAQNQRQLEHWEAFEAVKRRNDEGLHHGTAEWR